METLQEIVETEKEDKLSAWRDWFKFEGREYRIFKKVKSKDAPWYIYFERDKRRIKRCLDTNVKENAIANARKVIAAAKAERWEALEATKSRRDLASLGEVFEVYRKHPDERKPRTIAGNIGALKGICRAVWGDKTNVEGLSTAQLTGELVRRYKNRVVGCDENDSEDVDELGEQKAKRSANSFLKQARSLFAKHVLEYYADAKLNLPDLRGFMEATGFRKVGKQEYHAPADELIQETFKRLDGLLTDEPDHETLKLWKEWKLEERPHRVGAFTAVCLACGTGMRRGEIGQAKWSWFTVRPGRDGQSGEAFIRSDMIAKNGQIIDLPVIEEWWSRLQRVRADQLARGYEGDYILEGTKTERTDDVFDRVGLWMGLLGWKTQKKIHEFRAYVGSKVAEEHGIETASMFLRHGDLQTTKKFYMRYLKMREIRLKAFVREADELERIVIG